ncbi:hypothetical protein ABPG74_003458 [Tetrahymena malaccensis]
MSFYSNSTLSSIDLIETFELYDKNKDGYIDERDLSIVLNDLGQESDPIKVKKIMEIADLDKDGQINLDEFIRHMQTTLIMEYEEEQENIVDLFKIFKQNENGHINVEDLRLCVTQMGEDLSEEEFNDLVREFDSDKDGYISFEEFCRMMN